MRFLRRAVAAIRRSVALWLLRRLGRPADPWERLDVSVALHHYGAGIQGDFPAYLASPSGTSARSLDEIQRWLLDCAYQSDAEQFGRGYWQHVGEFETRRAGNCVDHAVWAWRKLVDIGVDATLVTGWRLPIARPLRRHAWVTFRDDSGEYLLETVAWSKEDMLHPLPTARLRYRPEFGVDRSARRFTYAGVLLTIREREGIDPLPPEDLAATG
jgi:hypothetical protein